MLVRAYTGVTVWWNDLKVRAQEGTGATAVEYALMVALIAVVIIAAAAFLGKAASNKFSTAGSGVETASGHSGRAPRPPAPWRRRPGRVAGAAVRRTWAG